MDLLSAIAKDATYTVFGETFYDTMYECTLDLLIDKDYRTIINIAKQYNYDIASSFKQYTKEELENDDSIKREILLDFCEYIIANYTFKIVNKMVAQTFK